MTEQGAQLLISAESGMGLPPQISPSLHKNSGVLKKKTTSNGSSARLEPIENNPSYLRSSMGSTLQPNE
jgi:hypothetical protein